MATGGNIKAGGAYVELSAKDGKLNAGLKSAQAMLVKFGVAVAAVKKQINAISVGFINTGKNINRMGNSLMTAGGSMLGVAIAIGGALGLVAKRAMTAGDTLMTMSQRTGTTVEWLSTMGYVAEMTGAKIEDVETALVNMNASIADGGTGHTWLRQIGVDINAIDKLDAGEKFDTIADALSNVENQSNKTKAALGIFQGTATKLLPMLETATRGKLKNEAIKIGVVVSTGDAARAAQVSESVNKIRLSIRRLTMIVGDALLPAVETVTNAIQPVVTEASAWLRVNQGLVVSVAKGVGVLGVLGLALTTVGAALKPIGMAFIATGVTLRGLLTTVVVAGKMLVAAPGAAIKTWQALKKMWRLSTATVKVLTTAIGGGVKVAATFGGKIKGAFGVILSIVPKAAAYLNLLWMVIKKVVLLSILSFRAFGKASTVLIRLASRLKGLEKALVLTLCFFRQLAFTIYGRVVVATLAFGAALLAVVGAIALVARNWQSISAWLGGAFKTAYTIVKDFVLGVVSMGRDVVMGFVRPFIDAFKDIGNHIREVKDNFATVMAEMRDFAGETFAAMAEAFKGGNLTGALQIGWQAVKVVALSTAIVLVDAVKRLVSTVREALAAVANHFWEVISWITISFVSVRTIFLKVIDWIVYAWHMAMTSISKGLIKITGMAERAWLRVKSIFSDGAEAQMAMSLTREQRDLRAHDEAMAQIKADKATQQDKRNAEQQEMNETIVGNVRAFAAEKDSKIRESEAKYDATIANLQRQLTEARNARVRAIDESRGELTTPRRGGSGGQSLTTIRLEPLIGSFSLKQLSMSSPTDLSRQQLDEQKKTNDKLDKSNRFLRDLRGVATPQPAFL